MNKAEIEKEIERIEKEADMKGIIKVYDYLYKGNVAFGLKEEDGWILDDGDIYTIRDLIENEEYKVEAITPLQIEEQAKLSQRIDDEKEFKEKIEKLLTKGKTIKRNDIKELLSSLDNGGKE